MRSGKLGKKERKETLPLISMTSGCSELGSPLSEGFEGSFVSLMRVATLWLSLSTRENEYLYLQFKYEVLHH